MRAVREYCPYILCLCISFNIFVTNIGLFFFVISHNLIFLKLDIASFKQILFETLESSLHSPVSCYPSRIIDLFPIRMQWLLSLIYLETDQGSALCYHQAVDSPRQETEWSFRGMHGGGQRSGCECQRSAPPYLWDLGQATWAVHVSLSVPNDLGLSHFYLL